MLHVCVYRHKYSMSMYQPDKAANPARGQLKGKNNISLSDKAANPGRGQLKGKNNISLSPFAPENLVSRDGFGSSVPRQPAHLHTRAESGAHLRDLSRVPLRVHLFISTATRRRVSPEFIGSGNCVQMAFTAESPPTQGQ